MAMWERALSVWLVRFAESIFHCREMICEATFYFVPCYDQWHLYFQTQFKYLNFYQKFEVDRNFINEFESFVSVVEDCREKIYKEYSYYFNALWC
jgi:hypothetical protein